MSKNTVDIANELLAEKAALEARVKELEAKLAAGKSVKAIWQDRAWTAEEELERLKAQEQVGEVAMMDYSTTRDNGLVWITLSVKAEKANSISLNDKMFSAAPRPAVLPPKPEWRDYFKSLGYQPQRFVVVLKDCDIGAVQHMSGGSSDYCKGFVDGTQYAIRQIVKAGGEIAE